jgi:HD-GYP domain-containing protein (c-di-GMP phosphodiesterase class II)
VAGETDPAGRLAADLVAAGVSTITILPRQEGPTEALPLTDQRESTMHAYARGLRAFKDVLRQDGVGDLRKIRRARRAVQGLVDSFLENEATVLALARVHGHDVKLFHHSLNVCVYSLSIGQRLSMSRRQLGELGLAALFHDIGKTEPVPAAEGESEEEAEERRLAQSPACGARLLLDSGTGHEAMLKAAVVAFEQRMHFDGGEAPHLFSRIITIADCYEALTCRRRPKDPEHSTYDAFQLMQAKAGTIFDPLLLKVLMGGLGVHPVGTVVELTTGEIAVVTGGPSKADHLDRPRVKILRQRAGALKRHEVADLAEFGLEGEFLRSIRRTLAPEQVFPSISDLVAAV